MIISKRIQKAVRSPQLKIQQENQSTCPLPTERPDWLQRLIMCDDLIPVASAEASIQQAPLCPCSVQAQRLIDQNE